jgi:demethylmenaquinone methyltransferase/2-methoxy-6-polyprenyl-1,4-benzoquinol methylase
MLRVAARKVTSPVVEADAMRLPVRNDSLDLVTVAFGFRNLANYRKGLEEMLRVLKPGGTAAILEFSTPPNAIFRGVYQFYSTKILPKIGAMLSGAPEAYTYLPESVKKFPDAPTLANEMSAAGFKEVTFERMTFGSVALHIGKKQ